MLRTMVSSVEAESNLVYFCRATVNLARNCSLVSSKSLSYQLGLIKVESKHALPF